MQPLCSTPPASEPVPEHFTLGGRAFTRLGPLGSGSFGVVFRVSDGSAEYALKCAPLASPLASADSSAAQIDNETRVLRALAAAGVAGVPRVVAAGMVGGAHRGFVSTRLGESLEKIVDRGGGRIDLELACAVGASVLSTLRACHAAGVVHRDLKPENICVSGCTLTVPFARAAFSAAW